MGDTMRRRRLGYTDAELSVVGFGAAAVGGGRDYGYVRRDPSESVATIIRGLECGINWIDTAPKYANGYSEELVGRALAEWGEPVFVATKCGYPYNEETGRPMHNLKRGTILREIEESLGRLGVERIDLYQIHWPMPDEDVEEAYRAVADLIRDGKVRFAGVSNFSVEQMRRVAPIHPLAADQPAYSMLNRAIETEIIPHCREQEIGLLVYSPMQSGLLSGKFTRERIASLPSGDWRLYNKQLQEPLLTRNLALVDELSAVASDHGMTTAQLAIAWTLRLKEVTSAIVGARTPEQIEATARAGCLFLDDGLLERVDSLLAATVE